MRSLSIPYVFFICSRAYACARGLACRARATLASSHAGGGAHVVCMPCLRLRHSFLCTLLFHAIWRKYFGCWLGIRRPRVTVYARLFVCSGAPIMLGFAKNSAVAGTPVSVAIAGALDGFSGLQTGALVCFFVFAHVYWSSATLLVCARPC